MTVIYYQGILSLFYISHDGLPGEDKCRPNTLDARPLLLRDGLDYLPCTHARHSSHKDRDATAAGPIDILCMSHNLRYTTRD